MTAAASRLIRPRSLLAALIAGVLIAGCGGSTVKPAAYVKSVCMALGSWKNTIQSAAVALQQSGAGTATPTVQKEDYKTFVASLVGATRRTTNSLRAAGTPSVAHGQQVAGRLTRAFERATRGLETASTHLNAVPTGSASSFRASVGAVSSEIRAALEQIALVPPGQSQELRSAAAKQPACQLLAG